MKTLLLALTLLSTIFLYAQNNSKFDESIAFFREKGIRLNSVKPPAGFTVYYNCDSFLFMKGIFGDTIKIYTTGVQWYNSLDHFKDVIIKDEIFGITQFAKNIDGDGRINVVTCLLTQFIYRRDSLYEIEDANPHAGEFFGKLFEAYYFEHLMDEATYNIRLDSLQKIEKAQAVYTPKLIFTKNMFQKNKKVKLSKKLNFEGDTIVLENEWIENGKKCYVIRINNKEDGEETTYSYAINEDMKFVYWEGCNSNHSK